MTRQGRRLNNGTEWWGIVIVAVGNCNCRRSRETARRVVDHFDLITGTSTGGIIAIALAMGATAEEIARFDETGGPTIFPKRNGI